MRLREVAWTDIEPLAELEAELFPQAAWSAATWWAELARRPHREYLLAEEDDRIAGYAGLSHASSVSDVMTLAVVPARRGRGVGSLLLTELLRRADQRGADAVVLEVRADNTAALRLYARHGFERISVRPRYYQPGDVDAHVLRRLHPRGTILFTPGDSSQPRLPSRRARRATP